MDIAVGRLLSTLAFDRHRIKVLTQVLPRSPGEKAWMEYNPILPVGWKYYFAMGV
jgi:hypothetical protein